MCDDELKTILSPARGNLGLDATTSSPASSARREDASEVEKVTSIYELVGILTHTGRTADSGHYISWIRDRINSILT